jgi:hypothetical protein
MATIQNQLVCDNSTLANFKQWAQAISTALSTFGWTQSTDTGQVNWSTIAAVPGSGAYVYEIWQPNDGLTTFYLKVEYGNSSGTNSPGMRLTLSSGTNGSGTPSGFVAGPYQTLSLGMTPPSTTTQYECNFSGAAGRFGAMMWRNGTAINQQQLFAVERSVDSTGAYTSAYATLFVQGNTGTNTFARQQSLVFGVGVAPLIPPATNANGGWAVRIANTNSSTVGGPFNGSIPFDSVAPMVGYYDYPCTMVGAGCAGDYVEGVTFTVSLYGSTRTFMPSSLGPFSHVSYVSGAFQTTCMRYD